MYYYVKKLTAKSIVIEEFYFDDCNIHQLYKFAYELLQECIFYEKVEIWQNYFNKDKKLVTLIKRASPPTKIKKKYDQRTGISFYSEL